MTNRCLDLCAINLEQVFTDVKGWLNQSSNKSSTIEGSTLTYWCRLYQENRVELVDVMFTSQSFDFWAY